MKTEQPKKKDINKYMKIKRLREHAAFLQENMGKSIQHRDREYVIDSNGAWRRKTAKSEIIKNSKDYK